MPSAPPPLLHAVHLYLALLPLFYMLYTCAPRCSPSFTRCILVPLCLIQTASLCLALLPALYRRPPCVLRSSPSYTGGPVPCALPVLYRRRPCVLHSSPPYTGGPPVPSTLPRSLFAEHLHVAFPIVLYMLVPSTPIFNCVLHRIDLCLTLLPVIQLIT